MNMTILYGDEIIEENIEDATEAFTKVLHYVSVVAQKHNLFTFNSEQEEKDYMLMKEWLVAKNKEFDEYDSEILTNGLNIVAIKVAELLNNLEKKVNDSISECDLLNVGSSMLRYYDLKAHIEYNEFLEAHTKEEIQECMKEYVTMDLEAIKNKKGGR